MVRKRQMDSHVATSFMIALTRIERLGSLKATILVLDWGRQENKNANSGRGNMKKSSKSYARKMGMAFLAALAGLLCTSAASAQTGEAKKALRIQEYPGSVVSLIV